MASKEYNERLKEYYNKFSEDKRLTRRHGQVEYLTSMHYIHECLMEFNNPSVLDIGAGTGRYSCALHEEGYDVTAVELFRCNINVLKQHNDQIKVYEGNALDLSFIPDESYDVVLLFGPLYHLHSDEDCFRAMDEAKRVCRKGGYVLVAYVMNDYGIITHLFKEGHYESLDHVDEDYHIKADESELYHMVRIEDIDRYKEHSGMVRKLIFAADGAADYLRPVLNSMDDEQFEVFCDYHLKNCERAELLGASSHVVDILMK